MPNYFYFDPSGQKQGPINDDQLQELVAQGIIAPETSLETESGYKGQARQIPGLIFPETTPPEAVPVESNPFTGVMPQATRSPRQPITIAVSSDIPKASKPKNPSKAIILGGIACVALPLLLVVTWCVASLAWQAAMNRAVDKKTSGTNPGLSSKREISVVNMSKAPLIGTPRNRTGTKLSSRRFTVAGQTEISEDDATSDQNFTSKRTDGKGIETSLHLAAQKGDYETVQKLISRGTNVNARDDEGWTPLHYAAGGGYLEIVELLVSNKANVNAKTDNGITPLSAAEYGHIKYKRSRSTWENIRTEKTIQYLSSAGGKR